MQELIDKVQTQILGKVSVPIATLLTKSIEMYEIGEYSSSGRLLSETMFTLLREEYYLPEFSEWDGKMDLLGMIRELNKLEKDPGKTEIATMLRIQEKAEQEDGMDIIQLESCFLGAVEVLESFLNNKKSPQKSKGGNSLGSPGPLIREEIEDLFLEARTELQIQKNFPKIQAIYQDYPHDREVQGIYYLFLSELNSELCKKEIHAYLENGSTSIYLSSLCISLLADMGFVYDSKKKLEWYQMEYPGEKDGIYAECMVFLFSYLKDQRERDIRRLEGLSNEWGNRKEPYYLFIESCYLYFFGREDKNSTRLEGLYLYKLERFREKKHQWEESKKREEILNQAEEKQKKENAVRQLEESQKNEEIRKQLEERQRKELIRKQKEDATELAEEKQKRAESSQQEVERKILEDGLRRFIENQEAEEANRKREEEKIILINNILHGNEILINTKYSLKSNSNEEVTPTNKFPEKSNFLTTLLSVILPLLLITMLLYKVITKQEDINTNTKSEYTVKRAETSSSAKTDLMNKNWSEYMGHMNWDDAKVKCKSKGMRLPTFEELESAYSSGLTETWKKDGRIYWSSTPYDAKSYYGFDVYRGETIYHYLISYYDVRCRR